MALDYPSNPTVGQIYISSPQEWIWDGEKWGGNPSTPPMYLPITGGELSGPGNLVVDGNLTTHGWVSCGGVAGTTSGNFYGPQTGFSLLAPGDVNANVIDIWANTINCFGQVNGSGDIAASGNISANTGALWTQGMYWTNNGGAWMYCPWSVQSGGSLLLGNANYVWFSSPGGGINGGGGCFIYGDTANLGLHFGGNGSLLVQNTNGTNVFTVDGGGNTGVYGNLTSNHGSITAAGEVTANSNLHAGGGVVYLAGAYWQWTGEMWCPWQVHSGGSLVADGYVYAGGAGGVFFYNYSGWLRSNAGIWCNNISIGGYVWDHDLGTNGIYTSAQVYLDSNLFCHSIYYLDQGNGNWYQLRWDGAGMYCWVNTVGYIPIGTGSAREYKRNIEPTDCDALTAICELPLYHYDMHDGPLDDDGNVTGWLHRDCGWIADELEEHVLNSVQRLKHQTDDTKPDGMLPHWQPCVQYAYRAIQQLAERNQQLEARLAALEAA